MREHVEQLVADCALGGDLREARFQHPERVTLVEFAPALPADDGRRLDEDDSLDDWVSGELEPFEAPGAKGVRRVRRGSGCRSDLARRSHVQALEHRLEERLLAFEVVVERAAARAGRCQHGLDRGCVVPVLCEELRRGFEQASSCGVAAEPSSVLAHRTILFDKPDVGLVNIQTDCQSNKGDNVLERRLIETPSGTLAVVDVGEGPAALFVHGVFTSADLWHRVLAALSSKRRCIAVDLPGHGHSPLAEDQEASVGAIAALLESLCQVLGLESVDLVGNDTGGAVCQVFAALHPQRIRTLTLTNCDTAWNMPPAEFTSVVELARRGEFAPRFIRVANDPERARSRGVGPGYERPDELDAELIESYVRPFKTVDGAAALERVVAAIDARDLAACQDKLATLAAPTLIVWGTGDQFFPLEDAHRLRDTIAGADEVVEVEGAKLFFPDERADELTPLLRRHWQAAVPA